MIAVVLCRNRNPKLLALSTLRSQLALPLVFPARPRLVHWYPRGILFRHHLGRSPLRLRPPLHLSLLGPAGLRHGSGRSTLGTDALGNIKHRSLPPLGRWSSRIGDRGQESVALARCARLCAGSRVRHDTAADLDALPRLLHAHRGTGSRIHCYHLGESHRTRQDRPRHRLPRFLSWRHAGTRGSGLLVGAADEPCGADWVLYVF